MKKIIYTTNEIMDFFDLNVEEKTRFYKKYYLIRKKFEYGYQKDLENFKVDMGKSMKRFQSEYSNVD